MGKKTVAITIEQDLWKKSKKVLLNIGMSRSTFIGIVLKGVVDSEILPADQLFSSVTNPIIESALKHKPK